MYPLAHRNGCSSPAGTGARVERNAHVVFGLSPSRAIMVTSTLDLKQVHRRCVPQRMREMRRPLNDGHELIAVVTALANWPSISDREIRSSRAYGRSGASVLDLVSQSHDERSLSLSTHPGRRRAHGGAGGGAGPLQRCSRRSRGWRGR
jgi:hypothetical protein